MLCALARWWPIENEEVTSSKQKKQPKPLSISAAKVVLIFDVMKKRNKRNKTSVIIRYLNLQSVKRERKSRYVVEFLA